MSEAVRRGAVAIFLAPFCEVGFFAVWRVSNPSMSSREGFGEAHSPFGGIYAGKLVSSARVVDLEDRATDVIGQRQDASAVIRTVEQIVGPINLADLDLADYGQKRASTNSVKKVEKTAIAHSGNLSVWKLIHVPRPFLFVLILAIYFVIETTM
jgi:hypothetical protein